LRRARAASEAVIGLSNGYFGTEWRNQMIAAAQPQIDGAFVEDSMGLGVLRTFQNAHRPIPAMTGEAQKAFLLAWKRELDSGTDMRAFAQPNPPGISRNAIGITSCSSGWSSRRLLSGCCCARPGDGG